MPAVRTTEVSNNVLVFKTGQQADGTSLGIIRNSLGCGYISRIYFHLVYSIPKIERMIASNPPPRYCSACGLRPSSLRMSF